MINYVNMSQLNVVEFITYIHVRVNKMPGKRKKLYYAWFPDLCIKIEIFGEKVL